jgi:hypothetical protein
MAPANQGIDKPRLQFVVYHDEGFGAWFARCLSTGHTSLAAEKDLAVQCLVKTIEASLRAHLGSGQPLGTWERRYALRPGERVPGAERYDEARAQRRDLESGAEALVCG